MICYSLHHQPTQEERLWHGRGFASLLTFLGFASLLAVLEIARLSLFFLRVSFHLLLFGRLVFRSKGFLRRGLALLGHLRNSLGIRGFEVGIAISLSLIFRDGVRNERYDWSVLGVLNMCREHLGNRRGRRRRNLRGIWTGRHGW